MLDSANPVETHRDVSKRGSQFVVRVTRLEWAMTASGRDKPMPSRRVFLGGCLATGASLLAACGGSGTGTSTGAITVGMGTDLDLRGVQRFVPTNMMIRRTVFENLLYRRVNGEYIKALASGWKWSNDHKRLVITLRDDVKFHNGRSFGPKDVVESVKVAIAPETAAHAGGILKLADDVRESGKHEVTIDGAPGSILDGLSILPIIDYKTFDDYPSGKNVIGTGPFKWGSYSPGDKLDLKKNPDYWMPKKPHLDRVTCRVIDQPEALLAALRSEEIDLATLVLPRDGARLRKEGRFDIDETAGFDIQVGVNTKIKPLGDQRARQAIAWSLDRKRIANQVFKGFGKATTLPWPASTPGMKDKYDSYYGFDPAKARRMLEAAGADGARIGVAAFPGGPTYSAVRDIVMYNLKHAGLRPHSVAYEAAEFSKGLQKGTMPGLWVQPIGLSVMGPATALATSKPLLPTHNASNVDDPTYRHLAKRVWDAATDSEKSAANSAVTKYLLDQAFHLTVARSGDLLVSDPDLEGVKTDITEAVILTNAR